MTLTAEQIICLYDERRRASSVIEARMLELQQAYKGALVLPLPELDRNEKSSVANLIQQGLDGSAQRTASTMPDVVCPAEKNTRKAEQNAADRRRALLGLWEHNTINLVLARRARHLIGHGRSPVLIKPDVRNRTALWSVREPLACYPADLADNTMTPDDSVSAYTRTVGWLRSRYPDRVAHLTRQKPSDTVTVLEYQDDEQITLLATATNPNDQYQSDYTPTELTSFNVTGNRGRWATILENLPNRAGRPTLVIPARLGLVEGQGQFDGMLGLLYNKARLAALELIAIEQGIFPKEWLVARQNEKPKIIVPADARQGIVGIVEGGVLDMQQVNPGYKTTQAIDRIEREARIEGGVVAEMTGESGSNIRTGARGAQVLSEAVEYRIMESQMLLQRSLEDENRAAIAVVKGWFGREKKSYYVSWRGAQGQIDYTPDDLFTTDHNKVRYSLAGSDLNGQVVRAGQLVGTGLMSKQSARRLTPEIEDPDREDALVVQEGLEQALLSSLQMRAQQGHLPPKDLSRIITLHRTQGMSLADAVEQSDREAQERQAADQAAAAGDPAAPVDPLSPEAQPGLADPGMGAEAGTLPEAIPQPGPSLANLSQMLGIGRRVEQAASA